ncbi:MAG: HEAT repeat domain-containing protein [Haloarculaceae archaeon]
MGEEDCGCGGDCTCDHDHGDGHAHGHSQSAVEQAREEPPDPQLDPTKSPGWGVELDSLADIEVDRDVTIGEMDPADLTAADVDPVADVSVERLLVTLVEGADRDRQRAALAFAERDPREEVRTALATAARTDDDDVRQFAVESLAKLGGDAAAEAAAVLAREDPDPWVRAEAVVAIDRLDRADQRHLLTEALDDDHHAVRRNALISEFKREGEDALPHLLDAVDDESERVREYAAHMLAGVDDDEARAALEWLVETAESDVVRLTAQNALEADPARFRRQFSGPTDEGETLLPGEDPLNRMPNL